MRIVDLTHSLENNMLIYAEPNRPNIKKVSTVEENGYQETFLSMFSHNGTHIDSTKHMNAKGKTLDLLEVDNFVGKAVLIELENKQTIELESLKEYKDKIDSCDFIIFKSGWDKYWGELKCLVQL